MITVDKIIAASFHSLKAHILKGSTWASPELNNAEAEGLITLAALGPTVDGFGVLAVNVPLLWSDTDDAADRTENYRVDRVYDLITAAISAHDSLLAAYLDGHRLVVSHHYHYCLGTAYRAPNGEWNQMMYTAFAPIPIHSTETV